jgi:P-type Ca2+ transporter type 2C
MNKEITGLTTIEAKKELEKYGYNELKESNKASWYSILFRQVKSNFIVYFLFVAMILSFFVEKSVTAYTILAVIVLVIGVGFFQEYKAEKAVEALKGMLMPISVVLRDGKEKEIPSKEIVPEDIIFIRTGEKIPADAVILEENHLLINESILTGESKEVKKKKMISIDDITNDNKIFMGSFVVNGKCKAKVLHTGMNTKFGKIAGLISDTEKSLPLQNKLNYIIRYITFFGVILALLAGILVLFRSTPITSEVIIEVLILVIAIGVSVFPEGFPVALITTLSFGAYRMAKQNAIVNRMSIIETLGETTVICSDKTGTITKGEMTVKKIFVNNQLIDVSGAGYEKKGEFLINNKPIKGFDELDLLIKTGVLCNNCFVQEIENDINYKISGTPTEAALLVLGTKKNIFKEDYKLEIIDEIPFNSDKKMMSVIYNENNSFTVYSKGAPEVIINKCNKIIVNGKIKTLTAKDKEEVLKANKDLNLFALRTIALAYKTQKSKEDPEKDLIFIGLVGLEDPPREEVKETIKICQNAGISVKMITGDNKETAISIAKQIGLDSKNYLLGSNLDSMTDDELKKTIESITIFARVRPEHKLRIVKALKENNEIVTMTGDGVNDAPALKEAHVGVAMGKAGTDVSRSVADLILKDDNFATIVNAVKEGRTIFSNLRKFVTYQLSCNFSEIFVIIIGVLLAIKFGWVVPLLLPLHILFMNMVTDNLPAITLGLNPSSKNIMAQKPRHKGILTKNLIILFLFTGLVMGVFTLATYYFTFNYLGHSVEIARTTALATLIILELVAAYSFRSFNKTILSRSPFVNKYLFFAATLSFIATIIIIYTPINKIFLTVPIVLSDWLVVILFSVLFAIIFDLLKILNTKYNFWTIE